MTKKIEIRWVSYPVIIDGIQRLRYGMFEVTMIDGAPAHAKKPRTMGFSRHSLNKQKFSRAGEMPTLHCTNAIDLDTDDWDGTLFFDHLPILS